MSDTCITVRAVDHQWRSVVNAIALPAEDPTWANEEQLSKSEERGESSMVCQTFASLFGLGIISGEASSTLQPRRQKIPHGQTKNSFQKVKERERERAVNQAWCVRLLHHCFTQVQWHMVVFCVFGRPCHIGHILKTNIQGVSMVSTFSNA